MKNVLVQFELPGVTAAQYDQVWEDMRATGQSDPKGLIHHVGAKNGNDWVVVDLWESDEAFAAFGAILGPLMAKRGLPDVQPRILPVHYVHAGKVEAAAGVA